MTSQPDCCQHPTLRTLRVVDEAPDGEIVLQICDACTTYWRVTVNGQMSFEGGEDYDIAWFDRLNDAQGNELLFGNSG